MEKRNKVHKAHLLALITVMIWGTTFISTKLLLTEFTPVEILLFRFLIGYLVLILLRPKPLPFQGVKKEIWYALAGISGVTVYFFCENIALTYTLASNVSVIVSLAPMFTAAMAFLFLKKERLGKNFFMGFLIAFAGILLINYNGRVELQLNPKGDLLAVAAAFVWAVYSVILKARLPMDKDVIRATRRIFFYGIVTMLPCSLFLGLRLEPARFTDPVMVGNLLYLGIFASALGYLLWNYVIEVLGTLKASAYIYVIPAITIIVSVLILKEPVNGIVMAGAALAVCGLMISEKNKK